MPARVYRFERRQNSLTFRLRSGDRICPTSFDDLAKFRFQRSKSLEITGLVPHHESLRFGAQHAFVRISGVREIMRDEPGSYNPHFREQKRQLATSCPAWREQFGMSDVFAGSLGKSNVRWKQLTFLWRFPTNTKLRVSWQNRHPPIGVGKTRNDGCNQR